MALVDTILGRTCSVGICSVMAGTDDCPSGQGEGKSRGEGEVGEDLVGEFDYEFSFCAADAPLECGGGSVE